MIYLISKRQSGFAITHGLYFHENKTLAKISEFTVCEMLSLCTKLESLVWGLQVKSFDIFLLSGEDLRKSILSN